MSFSICDFLNAYSPRKKACNYIYNIFFIIFKILQFLCPRNKYTCVHSRLLHEKNSRWPFKNNLLDRATRSTEQNHLLFLPRPLPLPLSLFLRWSLSSFLPRSLFLHGYTEAYMKEGKESPAWELEEGSWENHEGMWRLYYQGIMRVQQVPWVLLMLFISLTPLLMVFNRTGEIKLMHSGKYVPFTKYQNLSINLIF